MKYFCIIILCLNYKFAIKSAHSYKQCDINDYKNNDSAPVILKFPKITNITILNNKNNISQVMLSKHEIENNNQHLKINKILFKTFPKNTTIPNCHLKNLKTELFLNFSISLTKNNRTYLLLISNNTYNIANSPILIPQISNIPLEYNINKNNFVLKNVGKFDNNSKFSITCNNCLGQIEDDFNYTNIIINSNVTLNFASKLYCFVYVFYENVFHHETTILNYKHFEVNSTTIHFELPTVTFISDTVVELNFNFSTKTKEKRNELTYKLYFTCRDTWCLNVDLTKTVIPQLFQFGKKHIFTLKSLKPFTNYEIFVNSKLYDCDAFNDKLKQSLGTYKTLSGKPTKVTNLSYYYRNLTHLWIMFEDPYPPRGNIKHYITSLSGSVQNYYLKSQFKECQNNKKFKCGIIKFDNITKKLNVVIEHDNCTICQGDPAEITVNIFDNKYNESFIGDVNVTFTNDPNKVLVKFVQPYLKSGPFEMSLLTSNNNVKKNIPVETFNQNYTEELLANKNFLITLQASNKFEELNKIFYVQIKQIMVETHQFDLIETCNKFSNCVIEVKLPSSLGKVNRANMLISTTNESNLNYCLLVNDNLTNKKIKLIGKEDNITMNRFRIYTNESLINSKTHLLVVTSMLDNNCSFYRLDVETSLSSSESPNNIVIGSVFGSLAAITILAIFIYFMALKRKNKFKNQGSSSQPETELILLRSNEYERLIEDFKKIPNICKNKTTNIGCANMDCNRYKNIIPYDDTLVTLKNAKYINASFVQGYKTEKAYIATQAPMNSTINEFWQMIAEYDVSTIIMLTELIEDNKIQSEKYWPDIHQTISYQNCSVFTRECKCFSDYTISTIELKFKEKTKLVQHFQGTAWSSDTLPMYEEGYLKFLRDLKDKKAPMVVHCSAGCGRTGTFILCSNLMKLCDSGKKVSFAQGLQQLRQCRPYMVKNHSQYIYAHLILYNYMHTQQFVISIKENFNEKVKVLLPKLKTHLRQIQTFYPLNEQRIIINSNNRVSDNSHGYLSPINSFNSLPAVVVPCYRSKNKFIVTQQPHHPDVIHDFWRLVVDEGIQTIIVLNEFDAENNTVFYSQKLNESVPIDAIIGNIQTKDIKEDNFVTSHTVKLQDKLIQLIKMKNWRRQDKLPQNQESLFTIWQTIWNFSRDKILVCCHDGVTASGLFVGLCYFLEQINNEEVCNIFEALKNIKQSRYEFLESDEQVLSIAQMAQSHSDQIQHYTRVDEEADLINA